MAPPTIPRFSRRVAVSDGTLPKDCQNWMVRCNLFHASDSIRWLPKSIRNDMLAANHNFLRIKLLNYDYAICMARWRVSQTIHFGLRDCRRRRWNDVFLLFIYVHACWSDDGWGHRMAIIWKICCQSDANTRPNVTASTRRPIVRLCSTSAVIASYCWPIWISIRRLRRKW